MYNHNRDKSHFEHKIREIELLAEQIAAKHILYGTSNLFFEIQQLVGNLKREIESHCLTYSGGTHILDEQIRHLHEQDELLTFNRAKIYIVVEKKSDDNDNHRAQTDWLRRRWRTSLWGR